MPMIKKSITVTDGQEQWIQAQMATGNYATDSEVVREAIREKQTQSLEVEQIRAALIHAESRGFSSKTKEEIRHSIQAEMKKNGEL